MERNTFFCNLGLYIKSVLVLILLLGGSGSAWAQKTLPYSYGFENNNLATDGWTTNNLQNVGTYKSGIVYSSYTSRTGTYYFRFYSNENPPQYLISPILKDSEKEIVVSLYYRNAYAANTESFCVGYATVSSTPSTSDFTWYTQVDCKSTSYTLYKQTIPAHTRYIAIKSTTTTASASMGNNYYLCIDDISIEENDPYKTPTSFALNSFDETSATFSWTAGNSETTWQFDYSTSSDFTPGSGINGTSVSITDNPYTLSGLTPGTTYYASIRADYGGGNYSEWTEKKSFTTLEQYPKPVNFTLDSYTGTTATFSWEDGAGTVPTSWQIKYSTTSGFDPDESGNSCEAGENPYTLEGLTASTTYYARIRAYYNEGHYSDWNDTEVVFTPSEPWENFDNGIPETWYNSGFVTNRTGYAGQAFTTNSSNVLRTPRLYANAGEKLSYYITIAGTGSSYKIKAKYSTDRITWNDVDTYTESGTYTFTASTAGYYWIRFESGYYCSVDNINGFGPADVTNDIKLSSSDIPSTGTSFGDYTASVTLLERGGATETVTAQLYFDDKKVAENNIEINGNRDETIQLTFTPREVKTAQMYIKVIYNGETEEETSKKNVTISETTYVIDETGDVKPTLSSRVLRVNYHAQNGWNTVCMPFALKTEQMDQLFGSGWTAYYINSFSDGILNFKKVSSALSTATPYLVYAPNTDEVEDVIYFKSASIFSGSIGWGSTNITQTKGDASFIGTFAPMAAGSLTGKYGITNEGKLGKGSSSATIKGYRAYISISGEAPSRLSIAINDDTTTDLGFVRLIDKDAKDIYNLQGQKVKKAGKGIYVVNGRKVIIK